MAQDFGDDMGNALLNFVTRQAENYLRFGRGRERAFDWWQRHYKKEGNTPEQAKAMADPNSGIESHDGADTDSRTAVMDAEQTGSEIRPSDIREEQQYDSESYSLTGEARDMTAAKNQMDTETKAQETTREHGSSLPFNGEDVL